MTSKTESQPALSGPKKWAAATNLGELEESVEEIDAAIGAAERRKVELEASPGEFILAGGDVAARAREIVETEQTIAGMRGARAIIADRLAKVQDTRRAREWADRREAAQAKTEWLRSAWTRFAAACGEVKAASDLIGEIVGEIDEIERPMSEAGWRPGQLVHLARIRLEAAETLPPIPRGLYETRRYDADAIEIIAKQAAETALARGVHRSAHDIAKAERNGTFAEIENLSRIGFAGRTAA